MVILIVRGTVGSLSNFEIFSGLWCSYEKADTHGFFGKWLSKRVMLRVVEPTRYIRADVAWRMTMCVTFYNNNGYTLYRTLGVAC